MFAGKDVKILGIGWQDYSLGLEDDIVGQTATVDEYGIEAGPPGYYHGGLYMHELNDYLYFCAVQVEILSEPNMSNIVKGID